MPAAQSLKDLFLIREQNHRRLDAIDQVMGSALGRKNGTGDPAVLVFVFRKIGEPWLQDEQVVPKTLTEPGGLTCPTDVIAGESERDLRLRIFDREGADRGLRPLSELVHTNPLTPGNEELRDGLRGASPRLTPGCQLAYQDQQGAGFSGTLGCFARDRVGGRLGFLTNQHVGEFRDNTLWFPEIGLRNVGLVRQAALEIAAAERYGAGMVVDPDDTSDFRVDAAFCELHQDLNPSDVDFRLPLLTSSGQIELRKLGKPLPLDLDTMGPVGKEVICVGRTRGFQRGTIDSFAFEYVGDNGRRHYCDYLIVGGGDEELSDPGNSGSLIVSSDGLRPVALMWGGEWARRRRGRGLENWTNATDINLILDRLDIAIER